MTERDIQKAIVTQYQRFLVITNFTPLGWWECDVWSMLRSGYTEECEIKTSLPDFRNDFKKSHRRYTPGLRNGRNVNKHAALAAKDEMCPNRFYFVVPQGLSEDVAKELPEHAGLRIVITESGFRSKGYYYHEGQVVELKRAPLLHKRKVSNDEFRYAATNLSYRWQALKFHNGKEKLKYMIRDKRSLDHISSRDIDIILEML